MSLEALKHKRLNGTEEFHNAGTSLGFNVADFWGWSVSDLVSNATRGILAEYIVGRAIGADLEIRDEWGAYDLRTPEGTRIEVKSAAYLQTWFQKRLSPISFNCKKHQYWNPEKNEQSVEHGRFSDVYVFALLDHTDKKTVNPLDLSQWKFFVVPTAWLDARKGSQRSITLASLRRSFSETAWQDLAERVKMAAEVNQKIRGGEEVLFSQNP